MPSPLTDDVPSELPRVGRYEILLELQEEAFVSTMAARVRGPNTGSSIVELTKVEHTLARQAEVRAAFLAEARAAGRVRHINFVHPTDTLVHEGDLYVATEFILGVRLDELWRAAAAARFEIPLPVMLRILLDVVSGLSALHARHPRGPNVSGTRSIVHGDIAPTNILVSYRGDAKLLHSGLSCVTSLAGAIGQRNRRLAYKAPEQLRIGVNAVPIGPAADVFAMGALLWEVLQGRRLFDAPTDVEVVERILQGPLPSIEPAERRLPIALLPLVEMALERTAERRIPNAAQLGDAIEHAPGVRLATSDEVALIVDQLVGPLIERRRERVNQLFVLAESRSPSDSTLRPAIISHLRQVGAMKTPVGLVYPPPSGAPLSHPPSPSSRAPSFAPSDRWIDPSAPPASRHPSDSRWSPSPPSSGKHERRWDRSGSVPTAKARRSGVLHSSWLYYLAIGAALGGLVFEYFIEASPIATPQATTVLAPPPGAELPPLATAAGAGTVLPTTTANSANTPASGGDIAGTTVIAATSPAASPPAVIAPSPPVRIEPAPPRRAPPAPRAVPPRVRRPAPARAAPPPEGAQPAPVEAAPVAPPAQPTPEEPDWGI